MKCRICGNEKLVGILDFGFHPPSDAFLTKDQLSQAEAVYPLALWWCPDCTLGQLSYVVDPETLFNESYPYATGVNPGGVKHFTEFSLDVVSKYELGNSDLVVDIGSNDGTLLKGFQEQGCQVAGVEPCRHLAQIAKERGILTLNTFFSKENVKKRFDTESATVITATNVFAHIDDIHGVMDGVDYLLKRYGVFIVEAPAFSDMVKFNQFDQIYHEHLSYLSPDAMATIARMHGMSMTYEHNEMHGGSIRYFLTKGFGRTCITDPPMTLKELMDFAERVEANREKVRTTLQSLKEQGNRIVGVSAPAKGNTLLNYYGIGAETLDYLTDISPYKIGLYSPGQHLEVKTDEQFIKDAPEYALLLACNFKKNILKAVRKKGFRGKFIIPYPEMTVE